MPNQFARVGIVALANSLHELPHPVIVLVMPGRLGGREGYKGALPVKFGRADNQFPENRNGFEDGLGLVGVVHHFPAKRRLFEIENEQVFRSVGGTFAGRVFMQKVADVFWRQLVVR